MISLTCTNCNNVLEMDDAFAGGVCRCRHCGTIQTVPARAKGKKAGRTLYAKRGRDDAVPSSGLDQLAQAVASSGLDAGHLRRSSVQRFKSKYVIVAAAIGCVLVISCLALFTGSSTQKQAAPSVSVPAAAAAVISEHPLPTTPNFCGLPLTEHTVIYVLDRGSATTDYFSYLKEAVFKSARSLGDDRKFQIIFWNNGKDDAFPTSGPTFATAQIIESARRALDDIQAYGQSDVASALTKAVAAEPDAIILATAKSAQLDDAFADQVLQIRKEHAVKIYTFDLGASAPSAAMQMIARRSGTEARVLAEGELKRFGKE